MSHDFIECWQKKGLRVIPQRILIYEILARNQSHPSVEDIWSKTRDHYPVLSLNTDYKMLEAMVEANEVTIVETGKSKVWYEVHGEPHQHFHCRKCGKIIDFYIPCVKTKMLPKKYQDELDPHGVQINFSVTAENARLMAIIPKGME
jgi:Fe2+ or Zn2+ uptake regulation protein